MFKKSRFVLICVIFSLICVISGYAQEQITITTYYPSPYGSYNELRTYSNTYLATDSGNVGIGTTSPGGKLEIEDDPTELRLTITSWNVGDAANISFRAGATEVGKVSMDATSAGNIDMAFFNLQSNVIKEVMRLNAENGNVGIGTTGPGYKLDIVDNSANFTSRIYNTNSGSQGLAIIAGNSTGEIFSARDYLNNIRLTVQGSGNVGIGTTGPGAHLQVGSADDSSSWIQMGTNMGIYAYSSSYARVAALHTGTGGLLVEGNVGIGTTDPGTYKCYINGTGYLNAAAWVYGSDIRLKENISYIQSGLNVVEHLKPVKFDYINGDKKQVGFIAQEVQEILPDIVTEGTDGMLGIKTDSIIPYLVKAVQEQQQEIQVLKQEVSKLKGNLSVLPQLHRPN